MSSLYQHPAIAGKYWPNCKRSITSLGNAARRFINAPIDQNLASNHEKTPLMHSQKRGGGEKDASSGQPV